jgi:hypothetical protein
MRWGAVSIAMAAALSMLMPASAGAEDAVDDIEKVVAASKAPVRAATAANIDETDGRRLPDAGAALVGVTEAVTTAQAATTQAPIAARPLKLNTTADGLDVKVRRAELGNDEGWRNGTGGTAPSPVDVRNSPTPGGDPSTGGPSPVVSARDRGGVVGFSYKINPR